MTPKSSPGLQRAMHQRLLPPPSDNLLGLASGLLGKIVLRNASTSDYMACLRASVTSRSAFSAITRSLGAGLKCRELATTQPDTYELLSTDRGLVIVDGYTAESFSVAGVRIEGSLACVQDTHFAWAATSLKEIHTGALCLQGLVRPVPDIMILGTGLTAQPLSSDAQDALQQASINYEALDTANAISTFNVLNQEGRNVLGLFLPQGTEPERS